MIVLELARPVVRGAGTVLLGLGLVGLAAVYTVALWRMPDWMHQHDPEDRQPTSSRSMTRFRAAWVTREAVG
ncbi:hypothetical protein ABT299_24055 [Spirillospora sp. NPDC000708]